MSTTPHKRQGDLLFIRLGKARRAAEHPDGAVLARGEATGHAHAIAPEDLAGCEVFVDDRGRLVVNVAPGAGVSVRHEEHGTVTLDPGIWEVRRQREYDAEREWRRIAD